MTKELTRSLLCKVQDLEENWNLTTSGTNNNVYRNYVKNPKKEKQIRIMDMGVYCLMNDITPEMLKIGIKHIKEMTAILNNEDVKADNKIVIMTAKDYQDYQQFKNFKLFSKAQK